MADRSGNLRGFFDDWRDSPTDQRMSVQWTPPWLAQDRELCLIYGSVAPPPVFPISSRRVSPCLKLTIAECGDRQLLNYSYCSHLQHYWWKNCRRGVLLGQSPSQSAKALLRLLHFSFWLDWLDALWRSCYQPVCHSCYLCAASSPRATACRCAIESCWSSSSPTFWEYAWIWERLKSRFPWGTCWSRAWTCDPSCSPYTDSDSRRGRSALHWEWMSWTHSSGWPSILWYPTFCPSLLDFLSFSPALSRTAIYFDPFCRSQLRHWLCRAVRWAIDTSH